MRHTCVRGDRGAASLWVAQGWGPSARQGARERKTAPQWFGLHRRPMAAAAAATTLRCPWPPVTRAGGIVASDCVERTKVDAQLMASDLTMSGPLLTRLDSPDVGPWKKPLVEPQRTCVCPCVCACSRVWRTSRMQGRKFESEGKR